MSASDSSATAVAPSNTVGDTADASPPPVFVAGCGRSGTSYVRTILDAHPDVYIPSESLFLADYVRRGDALPRGLLNWLFYHEPQLRCWYQGEPHPFDTVAEGIRQVHRVAAGGAGARVWGQKTPRFIRYMDQFERTLGEMRWVLVYRDPRAVAASMKGSGQHTSSVVRACRRWLRDNAPIVAMLASGRVPANVLLLRYEDLLDHFDETTEELFRFVGVEPIGQAEIETRGRPVFFSRSRFPMNTVRAGLSPDPTKRDSWMTALTAPEIAYIEHACKVPMRLMGYEPTGEHSAPSPSRFFLAALRDVAIPFRYLVRWPEFLFYTLMRSLVIRLYPR